jgi:uncharacterized RDD family membrane protein YckC
VTGDRSLRAPHGLRLVAWLLDCLVLFSVLVFAPQPVSFLLLLTLFVGYHTVLVWLTGQTVGKALLGLRVKRLGEQPTFLWALGRAGAGYALVDVLGLGLLAALFDTRHRTLHDHVFGSIVTFDGSEEMGTRRLLARLADFAERQRQAVAAKKKTVGILTALWAFLTGFARTLNHAIDFLIRFGSGSGAPAPSASIAQALSVKAAATIALAATAATATVVATVPIAGDAAAWLVRPHYFLTGPSGVLPIDRHVLAKFDFDADVLDRSGRGNQARLLGGEFVKSASGHGLHIAKSDNPGIDWSDHATLLVHPYSIEMILTTSSTSPWGKLFGFDDRNDAGWYYKSDGIQAYPYAILGGGQVQANQRHYLAFVSTDPTTVTVYFQGKPLGSTNASFTAPPQAALFFRDDAATGRGEQLDAVVEELRISNVARTAAEIATVQERLTAKGR